MQVLSQVFPETPQGCVVLLRVLAISLNSYNGERVFSMELPSCFQRQILEGLLTNCERVFNWTERAETVEWEDYFRTRGIDYKGDEVLTAQTVTWDNVSPALPEGVGGVCLDEVVELGTQHYVTHLVTHT